MARTDSPLTPEQRSMHARLAAHVRWSQCDDRTAATAPATAAMQRRFEREVDPDGLLPAEERAKRAESARGAYMTRLQLASSRARAQRKGATP